MYSIMSEKNKPHTVTFNREDAYKLSEKQFEQAMENSPIGIALLSLEGKYMQVNQAFCEIVGYLKEELLQMNWKTITYHEDISANKEFIDKLLNNQVKTFQMVKRYIHKYGYPVWVQINASLVRDDHNKSDFVIVNIQDITKRKKMEDMLRESEERYRYIQKATDDVVWDWDLQKDRMYVADNFLTTFKYDPEYISQQPFKSWWLARLHPDDKERVLAIWEQVIVKNKESHFMVEYRLLKGDGQYAHILSQGYVFYKNGKAMRLLGVKKDITERKLAEIELRQSEERYGLVINNVTDLISIIDSNANYLFCSPSHNLVMGYKPQDLMGISALSLIHPDDLPLIRDQLHKIITGESGIARFRVRHKDGHFVTLEGSGKAIMDVYGNPYVLVITTHDISERIELEMRKDRFISMTSHELITPLTTLKAYMQILEKQSAKGGKQYHFLEKMKEQIEGLSLLAKELSDVSIIKNGGMELHPEKFLLDELVTDVAEDLNLISKQHEIIFKANTCVEIFADKYRISQVLTNLITNAIKFSPTSHKIIISIVEEFGIAVLKVQDFGIGISIEDQKNIFEAFYQSSNSMVQSRMGLGLGLHIVSQIVKEHRGTIEVKSEVGKGSTFIVHLPMLQRSDQKDKHQNRTAMLLAH
jgi:PAS domain S-box-containing protein